MNFTFHQPLSLGLVNGSKLLENVWKEENIVDRLETVVKYKRKDINWSKMCKLGWEEIPIVKLHLFYDTILNILAAKCTVCQILFKRIHFIIDELVCSKYFFATKPEYTQKKAKFLAIKIKLLIIVYSVYSLTVD